MSVAALSNAGYTQLLQASNYSGFQQAAQRLGASLASGNLPAAGTSFKQLQQLNDNRSGLGDSSPQLNSNLNALGKALKTGDLNAAKAAFVSVQSSLAGSNAAAITAAAQAAKAITQQIDLALNFLETHPLISGLFGANSTAPEIGSRTTSFLNIAYGNRSTRAAAGSIDVSA